MDDVADLTTRRSRARDDREHAREMPWFLTPAGPGRRSSAPADPRTTFSIESGGLLACTSATAREPRARATVEGASVGRAAMIATTCPRSEADCAATAFRPAVRSSSKQKSAFSSVFSYARPSTRRTSPPGFDFSYEPQRLGAESRQVRPSAGPEQTPRAMRRLEQATCPKRAESGHRPASRPAPRSQHAGAVAVNI